jgi:hypothetical protein
LGDFKRFLPVNDRAASTRPEKRRENPQACGDGEQRRSEDRDPPVWTTYQWASRSPWVATG